MKEQLFPKNNVLLSMSYKRTSAETGELSITFVKGQTRVYDEVNFKVAYELVYKKTASEVISFYSTNIKKKYKVIKVK